MKSSFCGCNFSFSIWFCLAMTMLCFMNMRPSPWSFALFCAILFSITDSLASIAESGGGNYAIASAISLSYWTCQSFSYYARVYLSCNSSMSALFIRRTLSSWFYTSSMARSASRRIFT